jgi:putative oxidoreductase
MNILQFFLIIAGRVCLSLVFILSGIHKILNWQAAEDSMFTSLCNLEGYTMDMDGIQKIIQFVFPWTSMLLLLGTVIELLGGILIFLGIKIRFGAFLLILFLVPTTCLFHHFWLIPLPERDLQMCMFLKNLSIFGGLLILLGFGKGSKFFKAKEKVEFAKDEK